MPGGGVLLSGAAAHGDAGGNRFRPRKQAGLDGGDSGQAKHHCACCQHYPVDSGTTSLITGEYGDPFNQFLPFPRPVERCDVSRTPLWIIWNIHPELKMMAKIGPQN